MRKLKLSVHRVDHRCFDTDGYWDGTWDESYEYIIYDEEGLEVDGRDGYHTEEAASKAGEEKIRRLEERK